MTHRRVVLCRVPTRHSTRAEQTASQQSLRAAVFLGLSVDGRIARPRWRNRVLTSRGVAAGDAGFTPFVESVDAVVMGRGTYECRMTASRPMDQVDNVNLPEPGPVRRSEGEWVPSELSWVSL